MCGVCVVVWGGSDGFKNVGPAIGWTALVADLRTDGTPPDNVRITAPAALQHAFFNLDTLHMISSSFIWRVTTPRMFPSVPRFTGRCLFIWRVRRCLFIWRVRPRQLPFVPVSVIVSPPRHGAINHVYVDSISCDHHYPIIPVFCALITMRQHPDFILKLAFTRCHQCAVWKFVLHADHLIIWI